MCALTRLGPPGDRAGITAACRPRGSPSNHRGCARIEAVFLIHVRPSTYGLPLPQSYAHCHHAYAVLVSHTRRRLRKSAYIRRYLHALQTKVAFTVPVPFLRLRDLSKPDQTAAEVGAATPFRLRSLVLQRHNFWRMWPLRLLYWLHSSPTDADHSNKPRSGHGGDLRVPMCRCCCCELVEYRMHWWV